jgi:preprotein translocase subunit SecA
MKRKFLSIIDTYWLSHIEYLEDLKYSITLNPSRDPFMEFEIASTKSFAEGLIPSMYNEMITYAINPSMKYGTYIIKNNDNVEEEKYVL